MKNILLLTDFSQNSINAIHYAMNLLKDYNCSYYLLHVKSAQSYTTDDLMATGSETIYSSIVKDAKDNLERIVVDLKTKFNIETSKLETLVDYDNLTDSIKQIVDTKHIDLIVMGTNGVTGAKEVLLGSNTINVIRNISCDTLIVPKDFTFSRPKEILMPLDHKDTLDGNAFNNASAFANNFAHKLHVLRVKPNSENVLEDKHDEQYLHNRIKNINYDYHTVTSVPMHYVVDCYIQTQNIDLLVLLVQPESLLERFFMGSPTTKISNAIRVPLMVFHTE